MMIFPYICRRLAWKQPVSTRRSDSLRDGGNNQCVFDIIRQIGALPHSSNTYASPLFCPSRPSSCLWTGWIQWSLFCPMNTQREYLTDCCSFWRNSYRTRQPSELTSSNICPATSKSCHCSSSIEFYANSHRVNELWQSPQGVCFFFYRDWQLVLNWNIFFHTVWAINTQTKELHFVGSIFTHGLLSVDATGYKVSNTGVQNDIFFSFCAGLTSAQRKRRNVRQRTWARSSSGRGSSPRRTR